jgi:hypothetical protein
VVVTAEGAKLELSSPQVPGGVQRVQIENLPINDIAKVAKKYLPAKVR